MTYEQIGKALGISRQMVGQLAKRGMPVDSVQAARAWRSRGENLHYTRTAAGLADHSGGAGPNVSSPQEHAICDGGDDDWQDAFDTLCWFTETNDLDRYLPAVYSLWVNGPDRERILDRASPTIRTALHAYAKRMCAAFCTAGADRNDA